ncbi:MAG TPA: hypothetical protein VFE11_03025, partial [Dongiaceae bacterium]|nr:hypothetical protein [Dongiaceae bacterium]
ADREAATPAAEIDRIVPPEPPAAHRPAPIEDAVIASASGEPHADGSHERSSDHTDDDRGSSRSSPPRRGWWKRLME